MHGCSVHQSSVRRDANDPQSTRLGGCEYGCIVIDDRCFATCETRHPSGVTLQLAYRGCFLSNCRQACGVHCGNRVWPSDACAACVDNSCCAPANACATDVNCNDLVSCEANCQDMTCDASCRTRYPAGVTGYDAVKSCVTMSCAAMCP